MASDGNYEHTTKAARVLKCLTDNPGLVVYRDDIMNATGLTAKEVRETVANVRQSGRNSESDNHPGRFVEIVAAGQAWQYRPNHIDPAQPVKATVIKRPVSPPSTVNFPPIPVEPPKPVARSSSDIFERVGKTDRHEIVVKDEAGKLFKVVPL